MYNEKLQHKLTKKELESIVTGLHCLRVKELKAKTMTNCIKASRLIAEEIDFLSALIKKVKEMTGYDVVMEEKIDEIIASIDICEDEIWIEDGCVKHYAYTDPFDDSPEVYYVKSICKIDDVDFGMLREALEDNDIVFQIIE